MSPLFLFVSALAPAVKVNDLPMSASTTHELLDGAVSKVYGGTVKAKYEFKLTLRSSGTYGVLVRHKSKKDGATKTDIKCEFEHGQEYKPKSKSKSKPTTFELSFARPPGGCVENALNMKSLALRDAVLEPKTGTVTIQACTTKAFLSLFGGFGCEKVLLHVEGKKELTTETSIDGDSVSTQKDTSDKKSFLGGPTGNSENLGSEWDDVSLAEIASLNTGNAPAQ